MLCGWQVICPHPQSSPDAVFGSRVAMKVGESAFVRWAVLLSRRHGEILKTRSWVGKVFSPRPAKVAGQTKMILLNQPAAEH